MSYDSDTESEVFDLPLLAIGGVVNGAPAATASDLTTASAALFDVSVEELTTTGPALLLPRLCCCRLYYARLCCCFNYLPPGLNIISRYAPSLRRRGRGYAYLAGPGARPTAWDEPAAWPSNWEEHLSLVRYTASLRLWRLEDDLDLSSDYCFESVEEEAAYETALRERMEID
uniref:ORF2 n=1 Tax=Macrostomum lignano TaxID=282301 RepID=A0A1I8J3N4_9PLAT